MGMVGPLLSCSQWRCNYQSFHQISTENNVFEHQILLPYLNSAVNEIYMYGMMYQFIWLYQFFRDIIF